MVAEIERSGALWASAIQPILKHRTLQLRRPEHHFQRNPIYLEQRTTVGNRIRTDCGYKYRYEDYFRSRAQYTRHSWRKCFAQFIDPPQPLLDTKRPVCRSCTIRLSPRSMLRSSAEKTVFRVHSTRLGCVGLQEICVLHRGCVRV